MKQERLPLRVDGHDADWWRARAEMRRKEVRLQEAVIVRQQRQKIRVAQRMYEALDCTDPRLTIARVRGWIEELR